MRKLANDKASTNGTNGRRTIGETSGLLCRKTIDTPGVSLESIGSVEFFLELVTLVKTGRARRKFYDDTMKFRQ